MISMERSFRIGTLFFGLLITFLIGQISAQGGCGEVDLIIIIDASTSVMEKNFLKLRDFCKDIVDNIDVDSGSAHIGVLIYGTEVEIQFNLNEYKTTAEVKAAIDRIPYIYGSTNTADAIQTMHAKMFTRPAGDRPNVPNVGIVLTDGVSNINSRRTIPEANYARRKNIEIYAIGIGLTDTREVDAIANSPTKKYSFNIREFDELVSLAETIFAGNGGGLSCAQDFPPVADAGDDVYIQLPDDTVNLNGNRSSDDIAIVRYKWEITAGYEDSVVSKGMDTAYPELSGLKAGLYVLKLTVYDQLGQIDGDKVDINVKAQYFPPVADAGDDIDIQLPDDTVTLNGDGSSDDIKVVRYQWKIIAGDEDSVVSKGMDTAYPELSGLKAGMYTLKLTVYDQLGQMDEDNVDINVKDADQKCQCSERLFKIEQETKLARTAIENMEHTLKELVKMKKNT